MKQTFTVLFFLIINSAFSQIEYSRFSIKPQFSNGVALPGRETLVSGSDRLIYAWKSSAIGEFSDGGGKPRPIFKVTNRLGLQFDYFLNDKIEIGAGANRTNLVSQYNFTFKYQLNNGRNFESVIEYLTYYDISFNFNYYFGNSFFIFQPSFIPDIFANSRSYADANGLTSNVIDYRNNVNTGVVFKSYVYNNTKYSLYFGYGRKAKFLDLDLEWQLGLNFSPKSVYTENVTYYTSGNLVGESNIKKNISAVFLTINAPIKFKLRKSGVYNKGNSIDAKADKLNKNNTNIAGNETTNIKVDIGDKKIGKGENLVLENIQFEQTKAALNPASMSDLDKVFEFLKKYKNSKIEITGHTSNEGSRLDNLELSRKRAEECKEYLLRKGIQSNRIKAYGLGSDRPVSSTNQILNRRVEMKIISID